MTYDHDQPATLGLGILPWHCALCFAAQYTLRGCRSIWCPMRSAILSFGHLFALGVAVGMASPLPLYHLMWSSPVLMTWYYTGNVMLYRQALLLF